MERALSLIQSTNPVNYSMSTIKLSLFGAFRVSLNGESIVGFRSQRVRALLAYLALADNQEIPRVQLAELLWNGYAQATALTSLRVALNNLHSIFAPHDLLTIERHTVHFKSKSPHFWCDAIVLQQLLQKMDGKWSPTTLHRASELSQGKFLPGFDQIDSRPFRDWLQTQRAHFGTQVAQIYTIRQAPTPRPQHNLPRMLTPLVGRETEIQEISSKVRDPEYPWVTLMGEGGVGKTRLALAVATQAQDHFADGVWFMPLQDIQVNLSASALPPKVSAPKVSDAASDDLQDQLAIAISNTLGLTLNNGQDRPSTQLLQQIQHKHLLLVLDNIEHLMAGISFIHKLLMHARQVKILTTSRRRSNFLAEFVYLVKGLPIPPVTTAAATGAAKKLQLTDYAGVRLFLERAARFNPSFQLNDTNQADVQQICQLVEGLPLGLKLAAALMADHSCRQIAEGLAQSYKFLASDVDDLPVRQRSIQATLAYSWQFLSETEAAVLAQCAVFGRGFTSAAAAAVAGATVEVLKQLEDHSLLQRTDQDRFIIHELVRQYALEQLQKQLLAEQAARQRHCAYYTNFLQSWAQESRKTGQAQPHIYAELDNIHIAWDWVINQGDLATLENGCEDLLDFYRWLGFHYETTTDITRLQLSKAKVHRPENTTQQLLAKLMLQQSCSHQCTGLLDEPVSTE